MFLGWLSLFIASTFTSGFWLGWVRRKSGAGGGLIGSLIALIFQLYIVTHPLSIEEHILLIFTTFILGWISIGRAEKHLHFIWGPQPRHTGEYSSRDYNATNLDEVHGQLLAGLPIFFFTGVTPFWQYFGLVGSFALFRFFDVEKPFGIKAVEERLKNPFGIMFDDSMAGFYAALLSWALILICFP